MWISKEWPQAYSLVVSEKEGKMVNLGASHASFIILADPWEQESVMSQAVNAYGSSHLPSSVPYGTWLRDKINGGVNRDRLSLCDSCEPERRFEITHVRKGRKSDQT